MNDKVISYLKEMAHFGDYEECYSDTHRVREGAVKLLAAEGIVFNEGSGKWSDEA